MSARAALLVLAAAAAPTASAAPSAPVAPPRLLVAAHDPFSGLEARRARYAKGAPATKDNVAAELVVGAAQMLALQSLADPSQASHHDHTARELARPPDPPRRVEARLDLDRARVRPYFAKHDHPDAAHFVIYRKGHLAIDSGADYTDTESFWNSVRSLEDWRKTRRGGAGRVADRGVAGRTTARCASRGTCDRSRAGLRRLR